MATYVLIHGAGSDAWYWHLVAPELRARGHDVVAPELPCDDDSAGFAEYADVVVEAIGARRDLVVVAQSLGGFTAPVVCERMPVALLVFVAAMIPKVGESAAEWWDATGFRAAYREQAARDGRSVDGEFDAMEVFFHDVPAELVAETFARGERGQSGTPMDQPYPLQAWPEVPVRALLCRDDRFFPADFMRQLVLDRLGIVADEMDGGHLPAFGRPIELVDRLETYRIEAGIH